MLSNSEKLIILMLEQSMMTTRELSNVLNMKIKTVRHYVGKLKKEGLVNAEVEGNIYYLQLSQKGKQCLCLPTREKKN